MVHHRERHTCTLILLVCLLLLGSTLALPVYKSNNSRGAKSEGKQLRAHLSEGAQPRFAEYPLLYAMGFPRN